MASEAKQETNRSDPDVVRLGPKFAPGTWFWQEAPAPARKGARAKPPRWVQYEQEQANRLEWCHQAGVQRVVFCRDDDWVDLREMVRSDGRRVRRDAPPEAAPVPRGPRSYEGDEAAAPAPAPAAEAAAAAPPPAPWDVPVNGRDSIPAYMRNKPADPSKVSEVGYPYWCTGSGAPPELLEKLAAELEASYKEPVKWEDPWVYRPTEEYVPDRVEVDPVPECLKELFDEAKNPCDMPSAY